MLNGHAASQGTDGMGSFNATALTWALQGTSATYETTFRLYQNSIAFEQRFPEGVSTGASGSNFVADFPALGWAPHNPTAGYVTWSSTMSGDHVQAGTWPTADGQFGARDGGPVLIFPKSSEQQWTLAVSAASGFMVGGVGVSGE